MVGRIDLTSRVGVTQMVHLRALVEEGMTKVIPHLVPLSVLVLLPKGHHVDLLAESSRGPLHRHLCLAQLLCRGCKPLPQLNIFALNAEQGVARRPTELG